MVEPVGAEAKKPINNTPKILNIQKVVRVVLTDERPPNPNVGYMLLYNTNISDVSKIIDRAFQDAGFVHSEFLSDSGREPFGLWVKRKLRL